MSGPHRRCDHLILLLTMLVMEAAVPEGAGAQGTVVFDHFFTSRTMRVDYYHTGGPGGETGL